MFGEIIRFNFEPGLIEGPDLVFNATTDLEGATCNIQGCYRNFESWEPETYRFFDKPLSCYIGG